MTCLPLYALWAKNDYHYYFDKVEGDTSEGLSKAAGGSGDPTVKVMSDRDMVAADDDKKKKIKDGGEPQSKAEIESILSQIELKRA